MVPCSECLLPQESRNTDICQLVFQVVPMRKQKAQMGNAHSKKQWLSGELTACRATSKAVSILIQISWSCPTTRSPKKTAEIENMGISIHMWSEEWVKRSMAGATEEKESTKQLEVTVRQKKFRKDFELVFWYVYISWEIEKIHMLPAGTLPDCQLYLQMISCRSIYSVESEEVHKISTTQ